MTSGQPDCRFVGPILQACPMADAVVAAIRELNAGAQVLNRGSYLRVTAPVRCVVTREAIERRLGSDFRMPMDLEKIMPSFEGSFSITDESAEWTMNRPDPTSDQRS